MIERAIEITAHYRSNELHAALRLESNQIPGIILTILHEQAGCVTCYDLAGHAIEEVDVTDGESVTFIARRHGTIIACLVNEVRCETARQLLLPKGGFNLILYQSKLEDEDEDKPPATTVHHVRLLTNPAARGLEKLFQAVQEHYCQSNMPRDIVTVQAAIQDALDDNNEEECAQIFLAFVYLLDSHGALSVPAIREAIHVPA